MKKGDVFLQRVGAKKRPCVIVKIFKDTVISIPLSKTEERMKLIDCSINTSFSDSCFTKSLVTTPKDFAEEHYIGFYEDSESLSLAVQEIKKVAINI